MNPIRIVSLIVTIAVIGFGISKVVSRVGDATSAASGSSELSGGDSESLFKTVNYAKAVETLRAKIGADGEVLEMRLEPGTVRWQVRKGQQDEAEGYALKADSTDLESFGVNLIGPGKVADNVFPITKLDPDIPEKLFDQVKERKPAATLDDVNFMTLDIDVITGRPQWSVNAAGSLYLADLDGSHFHQPGEGAGTVKIPTPTTTNPQDAVENAQTTADCIIKAGGDVARIQACTQ